MIRRLGLLAALAALACASPAWAQSVNPRAGATGTIVTGGTAVTALTGPTNGCYISNPSAAADQGIMTAEPIYVDPTGAAATTSTSTTNGRIDAGQTWFCVPYSLQSVSVNAATSGHKFTIVRW